MSRRYFDLALEGYSMAAHLSKRGFIVVTLDHPGVGESDVPDDPWTLIPEVVADVDAAAVQEVLKLARTGHLDGLPTLRPARVVGIGHSAGAMVLLYLQSRHRIFQGVGLLGWGAHGLPEHLDQDSIQLGGRPLDPLTLVPATRHRYPEPLVESPRGSSTMLSPNGMPDDARNALVAARARLLAVVGFASMIPHAIGHITGAIDVPVFLAVGDRDIARELSQAPTEFPACRDMTLFVLEDSGHNHNVEPGREILWDRLAAWVHSWL